jgi:transposase-like protein
MDPIKRYELIRPILTGEKTVEQVGKEAEVSSRTLYRYLQRFREGEQQLESLADQSHAANFHPKWFTDEDKAKVIRCRLENPSLSLRRLASELTQKGILTTNFEY